MVEVVIAIIAVTVAVAAVALGGALTRAAALSAVLFYVMLRLTFSGFECFGADCDDDVPDVFIPLVWASGLATVVLIPWAMLASLRRWWHRHRLRGTGR